MPTPPDYFSSDTLRPGQIPLVSIESTAEDGTKETLSVTGTLGAFGVGPLRVRWRQRTAGSPWGAFSAWLTSPETGIEITRHALRVIEVEGMARDNGICDLDCNELESKTLSLNVQPRLPALTEDGVLEVDTVDTAQLVADAVTATEIDVSELSAISADLGTVTVGTIDVNVIIRAEQLLADKIGMGPNASPDAQATVSLVHFREDSADSTLFVNAGKFTPQANDLRFQGLTSRPKLVTNSKTGIVFERMTVGHPTFSDLIGAGTPLEIYGLRIYDVVRDGAQNITTQWGLKIEDISVGTTKFAIQTGTGLVSFGEDVTVAGIFNITSTDAHAIGGAPVGGVLLEITGTVAKTQGLRITTRLQPGNNLNAFLLEVNGTLDIGQSGTHPNFAAVQFQAPTITAEAAALTNATTVKILNAPTAGVNNRALWVASGLTEVQSLTITTIKATGAGDSSFVGKLGIGVTGPIVQLEVRGSLPMVSVHNGTNWVSLRGDSPGISWNGASPFLFARYSTFPTSGFLEMARFTQGSNNFLIATTTDSGYRLDVNGTVRFSGALEMDGDLNHDGSKVGFYGAVPLTVRDVTGSRSTGNAALANLLFRLDEIGLITDSSVA